MGPLRRLAANPRYFSADGVRPVYLTGSHTWINLVDGSPTDPPASFDYARYLVNLKRWNHNFIRMWAWDSTFDSIRDKRYFYAPHPYVRSGPGTALDGKPKFDLSRLNRAYFDRLRARVVQARRAGIYVSVMLFEGYTADKGSLPDAYRGHPFAAENNINGIDGDANNDGRVNEIYRLPAQGGLPKVNELQKAYVQRVINSLSDLDNVLYEIVNEAPSATTAWQYELIDFIKTREARKAIQHPVGMTFQWADGNNETLFQSPADWISTRDPIHQPPVATGAMVIVSDTDHHCGVCSGANADWVWRDFTRGRNPIFMDAYGDPFFGKFPAAGRRARVAMGDTRRYAERMNLAAMKPRPALSSTGYVLADSGREYLVYQPNGGPFTVALGTRKRFDIEWFSVVSRTTRTARLSGRPSLMLSPPFEGAVVAHLRVRAPSR